MPCGETRSIVLVPPTRAAASGQLDLVMSADLAGFSEISLTLVVLSATGTGQALNVSVLTAEVNETDYFATLLSFAQVAANGSEQKYSNQFGRFLSAKWTVTGTSPVFVFTLVGTAKA